MFLVTLVAVLLLPLLAHAYVGLFSRYAADDYCLAVADLSNGLLAAIWDWYTSWTGSWSAIAAMLLARRIPPTLVGYWSAFALSSWLALLAWIIWQLRAGGRRWRRWLTSMVLAELIIVLTLDGPPLMAEQVLYWLNAGLRYLAPQLVLAACVGVGLYALGARSAGIPWFSVSLVGGLAFLATGFAETHLAAQVAASSVAFATTFLVSPSRRRQVTPWILAALCGSVLGAAVVVLAPGTVVRQSHFGTPPGPLRLSLTTLEYAAAFVTELLARAPWNVALATVVPATLACCVDRVTIATIIQRHREAAELRGYLFAIPLGMFILISAALAPAAWALSVYPPVRAILTPQCVLFAGLVAWGYLLGRWIRLRFDVGASGRLSVCAPLALGLACLYPIVTGRSVLGRRTEAIAYARTWDALHRDATEAAANGVPAIARPTPENLGGMDMIGAEPSFWVNGCVSGYYGVAVTGYLPPPLPTGTEQRNMTRVLASADVADIIGYTVSRDTITAGALSVRVEWLPIVRTDRPYKVLVAMYDSEGQPIVQQEADLMEGRYGSHVWIPGRPFIDTYVVRLPGPAQAVAQARLFIGLYDEPDVPQLVPASVSQILAGGASLGNVRIRGFTVSVTSLPSLPDSSTSVRIVRGITDGNRTVEDIPANVDGVRTVRVHELERLQLLLGADAAHHGFLVREGELHALLPGMTLDTRGGVLHWLVATGLQGIQELAFVREEGGTPNARLQVQVYVDAPSARSTWRMAVGAPVPGTTVTQPFVVGGWALDLTATSGSGVGTVDVWAYPEPGPGAVPILLGSSESGAARPDVGEIFGSQFAHSGFGLFADKLQRGDYDLAVVARRDEVGPPGDARFVHITVR